MSKPTLPIGISAIDSSIEPFDLSKIEKKKPKKSRVVSFWLPDDYKEKYDLINKLSGQEFGHHLIKVIKNEIDKVSVSEEDEKAS